MEQQTNTFLAELTFMTQSRLLSWEAIKCPDHLIYKTDFWISLCFFSRVEDIDVFIYKYRRSLYDGNFDNFYHVEVIKMTCERFGVAFYEIEYNQELDFLFSLIIENNLPTLNSKKMIF